MSNFSGADRLLNAADRASPKGNGVIQRLLRNYRAINELNQRIYAEALRLSNGKVSTAARMLGVTRPQFVYRARGIEREN